MKANEKGEIMLEALVVYIVTICLLFLILAFCSVLYQRWNIQTIANEVASKAAQTYRFIDASISSGEVTEKQISDVRIYRYLWNSNELKDGTENRVIEYASWRLQKTTFAKNVVEPQFDIAIVHDSLARRHIEVCITGAYTVPLGDILYYFGLNSVIDYSVTAYAECVDIIDYVNTVDFASAQINANVMNSKLLTLVEGVFNLWGNIWNHLSG